MSSPCYSRSGTSPSESTVVWQRWCFCMSPWYPSNEAIHCPHGPALRPGADFLITMMGQFCRQLPLRLLPLWECTLGVRRDLSTQELPLSLSPSSSSSSNKEVRSFTPGFMPYAPGCLPEQTQRAEHSAPPQEGRVWEVTLLRAMLLI